jgi:hypothetical protein
MMGNEIAHFDHIRSGYVLEFWFSYQPLSALQNVIRENHLSSLEL